MNKNFILPPIKKNYNNELRKVGYEIEFSGLSINKIVDIILNIYGGEYKFETAYKAKIKTSLGDFKVELDFMLIKEGILKQELKKELNGFLDDDLIKIIEDFEKFIASISEKFVPYEVVTPPVEITNMQSLISLEDSLRENGALGTTASIFYGFGLHINPEVPSFDAEILLKYLKAFICLYEWLLEENKVDLTRRLLPFINPFENDYIELILNKNYKPTIEQFIDDYIEYNPTRNRPLDMLPLFAYIDESRVRAKLPDEKISKRPTFHYRLSDSRIDSQKYNLAFAWNNWVEVEKLTFNDEALKRLSNEYLNYLNNPISLIFDNWVDRVREFLSE